MLSVLDAVILLFLLLGAVLGFKKGIIKSVVSFIGTILVIVLSFTFKNALSEFLYLHFPFFHVGVDVLNVLIYEGIAFLILFSLLSILLRVVIKISGIIETVLKFTIILGIPSKILGAIFGFLEMYLFIFVALFALSTFNVKSSLIEESKFANFILTKTPFASGALENSYNAVKEIVTINKEFVTSQNKEELNQNGLEVLLKYNVLSKENATILIEKKKITFTNAREIVEQYKGDEKND